MSQAEGHADAPILLALPHEPHVLAVGLVDEEVHVQVGEIHFRYSIVAAEEFLNSVKPLHLEVLAPYVTIRLAEVHTALHLAGTLLWYGEC